MGRKNERQEKANVLIVGSGGREHALGWKLRRSPKIGKLFFAPGNAGTAQIGTNVMLSGPSLGGMRARDFVLQHQIGLVVPSTDTALAEGVTDQFLDLHIPVFGPTRELAKLEASKQFGKKLMAELGIPTPRSIACKSPVNVLRALGHFGPPYILKQNGLAHGKGVHDFPDSELALSWASAYFRRLNELILVEEFVPGPEASMLALCDGKGYVLLPPAMDHKRAFDGDKGGMTGGMGCVAPAPIMSKNAWEAIGRKVIKPIVDHFAQQPGRGFRGCLFAGLKLTPTGPMVLEYNVRFGDPETQALMPILWDDLSLLLFACANGSLPLHLKTIGRIPEQMLPATGHAVTVVVSDANYPKPCQSPVSIPASALANLPEGILVFHGNTSVGTDGSIVSRGGRILSVTAMNEPSVKAARDKVYDFLNGRLKPIPNIRWREDIGANIPSF